ARSHRIGPTITVNMFKMDKYLRSTLIAAAGRFEDETMSPNKLYQIMFVFFFGWPTGTGTLAAETAADTGRESAELSGLPRHTFIYGGDFFCARRLNYALLAPREDERKKLLGDVAGLLRNVDLAMINLEGMITTGGYYNRLRKCTYMYRAHPNVLAVLQDAGIDLVTIGNNHNGDYGPEGMLEETDHLVAAGLEYAGGGVDARDAARPVYFQVGETVVAIIGMELTVGQIYAAELNRPGVHFLRKALISDEDDQYLIQYLTGLVQEARRHAHIVIFSPHWDAWEEVPAVTPAMRRLARRLIENAGFDAILAHGRHYPQGVEVFRGKPVVYDAGNCLADFDTTREDLQEQARGMLWQAEFSKAGLHRLEGIPIHMEILKTHLASDSHEQKALDRVERLSRECGTGLRIENGRVFIDLDPGGILEPTESLVIPKRPRRPGIRRAPTDVLHEKLPDGVTPLDVRYQNGIRLVGYELLSPSIAHLQNTSLTVVLYWQTDKPVKESYVIHLDSRPVIGGVFQEDIVIRAEHHLPGDWLLPTYAWPVGKVIQDKTNLRMMFKSDIPEGIAFFTGLRRWDGGAESTLLTPIAAGGVPLFKDQLVPLGQRPISKDAPSARSCYQHWRATRKIQLSRQQPYAAPPLDWPPPYGGE
ncbi:MAG: CapA family protein, partial [Pirellulales bacterium]|nr:CapA family protein [Pirellulales bacterium]